MNNILIIGLGLIGGSIAKSLHTNNHELNDAVRGANHQVFSNLTNAETTPTNHLNAFNSDGFTLGNDGSVNTNSSNYCSWNWKANGQGSSNTDGTIDSTYTSANTTSGFSIITYTGTGSAGTVGHGLGTTPSMVWIFNRTDGGNGHVFHKALGSTQYLLHASALGVQTYAPVGIGSLTSSTFSVGTVGGVNGSSKNYVAYVFAEKNYYFHYYLDNQHHQNLFLQLHSHTFLICLMMLIVCCHILKQYDTKQKYL